MWALHAEEMSLSSTQGEKPSHWNVCGLLPIPPSVSFLHIKCLIIFQESHILLD